MMRSLFLMQCTGDPLLPNANLGSLKVEINAAGSDAGTSVGSPPATQASGCDGLLEDNQPGTPVSSMIGKVCVPLS